jgi:hypothetical protein
MHAHAEDRPSVRIDDLHAKGRLWAGGRTAPTLLLSVTPRIGLTIDHLKAVP